MALLEAIRHQGKEWDVLAPRYGVTNPNPPWKTSLIGTCECLAVGGAFPRLTGAKPRMSLEMRLSRRSGAGTRTARARPYHAQPRLVTEGDLAARMRAVRSRLEEV